MTATLNRRTRKGSALLATTAVLGVATVATLATWTVTEFVKGEFKTGEVSPLGAIEASTDGTTWATHQTSTNALALNWAGATVTSLAGNDVIAAPYALRATEGTTANTRISLSSEIANGVANDLTYTVYKVGAKTDCSPTTTGTSSGVSGTVLAGAGVGGGAAGTTFDLAPGTASAAGATQWLCVKVEVPDTADQDTQTDVLFKFTAQK
jgi:hypothetical protein